MNALRALGMLSSIYLILNTTPGSHQLHPMAMIIVIFFENTGGLTRAVKLREMELQPSQVIILKGHSFEKTNIQNCRAEHAQIEGV